MENRPVLYHLANLFLEVPRDLARIEEGKLSYDEALQSLLNLAGSRQQLDWLEFTRENMSDLFTALGKKNQAAGHLFGYLMFLFLELRWLSEALSSDRIYFRALVLHNIPGGLVSIQIQQQSYAHVIEEVRRLASHETDTRQQWVERALTGRQTSIEGVGVDGAEREGISNTGKSPI